MTAKIIDFTDLEVYQRLYKIAIIIHRKVIPTLPDNERFGLKDQLGRSSKSPCALIAEGYARRYYGKEWKRYIREAIGECNEMVVHLYFCKDLYPKRVDIELCDKLIGEYRVAARQLFRLGESWK